MTSPRYETARQVARDLILIDLLIAGALILGSLFSSPAHAERDYGRDCLALTMAGEQYAHEVEGMALVGTVILNRTRDPRWPDSICGVVEQYKQLDGFTRWERPVDPARLGIVRLERAHAVIERLFNGTYELPGQCVSDKPLLYFHSGYPPWWAHNKKRVCELDNHVFYSEP